MRAIWPGALVAVYLLAALVLLIIGRPRVSPGGIVLHAALLVAVVTGTWLRTVPRWLRAWLPLLTLLALYSELPMLIRAAGHTGYFDDTVIGWEQIVFGAQPAVAWARALPSASLSDLLHLAYLSYYVIIFATPALLYRARRHAEFSEVVFALMATFVVCCLAYVVFPVAGPRYRWSPVNDQSTGALRAFTLWLLEARSSRGTAFPSSHVAVSVTQSIMTFRCFGRRGSVVAVATLLLAAGAVYGGFHYAVDVFAGAATGVVCTVLASVAFRRLASRGAPLPERDGADVSPARVVDAP